MDKEISREDWVKDVASNTRNKIKDIAKVEFNMSDEKIDRLVRALKDIDDEAFLFSYEHSRKNRLLIIYNHDTVYRPEMYHLLTDYKIDEVKNFASELFRVNDFIFTDQEIIDVLVLLGYGYKLETHVLKI